jgi:hypothetical protein
MMPLQGSLSIERMCEVARVSRASFYRSIKEQRPAEEETVQIPREIGNPGPSASAAGCKLLDELFDVRA